MVVTHYTFSKIFSMVWMKAMLMKKINHQCFSLSNCSPSLICPHTSFSTSHYPCSTYHSSTQPLFGHYRRSLSCELQFSSHQQQSSSHRLFTSEVILFSQTSPFVSYRLSLLSQMSVFISLQSPFPPDVIHFSKIVPYLLDIVLHLILIISCYSVILLQLI